MNKEERATEKVRVYPTDGDKLRIMAAKAGKGVIPADIIHNVLKGKVL